MMKHNNILIVEDEKNISDVIKAYLEKEGYNTFLAFDGKKALDIFENEKIDLIILDLMLPIISGEEVCTRIRNLSEVPIIMLTAKSEEDDKIQGLSLGADDYVVKPFSTRELVERVKAIIRRSYRAGPLAQKLIFKDGLEIDIDRQSVYKKDDLVDLTTNEFKVLQVLVSNPQSVFSRNKLIEKAFGYEYEGFDRTIDTYIKNIRHKIEKDPKNPEYILTVYGAGYKFEG